MQQGQAGAPRSHPPPCDLLPSPPSLPAADFLSSTHFPPHSPAAELNAAITGNGLGNSALTNLPRKINIGLSSTRDDFAHCHINDVGLKVGG